MKKFLVVFGILTFSYLFYRYSFYSNCPQPWAFNLGFNVGDTIAVTLTRYGVQNPLFTPDFAMDSVPIVYSVVDTVVVKNYENGYVKFAPAIHIKKYTIDSVIHLGHFHDIYTYKLIN